MAFLKGLERGYAVIGVNYRLSGEAIFPAGLQDIKAAIRWLRQTVSNTTSMGTGLQHAAVHPVEIMQLWFVLQAM